MFFENLYKLHGCEVVETIIATRNVKKNIMFPMELILKEKKGEKNNQFQRFLRFLGLNKQL